MAAAPNWKAVHELLYPKISSAIFGMQSGSSRLSKNRKAHAIRVAWRIIHTWVKAQLALVDINMATIPQVFLPYAIMQDGRTLAEHAESNPGFLLGRGS